VISKVKKKHDSLSILSFIHLSMLIKFFGCNLCQLIGYPDCGFVIFLTPWREINFISIGLRQLRFRFFAILIFNPATKRLKLRSITYKIIATNIISVYVAFPRS
jgi:hypothetical protein